MYHTFTKLYLEQIQLIHHNIIKINLLSDDIPKKILTVERQEACVQTTLPLTQSDCPTCNCQNLAG